MDLNVPQPMLLKYLRTSMGKKTGGTPQLCDYISTLLYICAHLSFEMIYRALHLELLSVNKGYFASLQPSQIKVFTELPCYPDYF